MLESMTGYGKEICEFQSKKIVVEIKSLNSKQLDLVIKLPACFKEKEILLRNELKTKLDRGKVELTIWMEAATSGTNSNINTQVFKNYFHQLTKLAGELSYNIDKEQLFLVISHMPDLFSTEQEQLDEGEWEVVYKSFHKALERVKEFRNQEGMALELDILQRNINILQLLDEVKLYEKNRIENVRNRIMESMQTYIKDVSFDANRLEQELIYYIERFDITEEKVRLANHCKYFADTITADINAGRKLGFITQEMGREINTLGSKANESEIQKLVVKMKDELEKIKEQLMNIL
jgi:uncharacterized protein (TIGR00255 family)